MKKKTIFYIAGLLGVLVYSRVRTVRAVAEQYEADMKEYENLCEVNAKLHEQIDEYNRKKYI